MWTFEGMPFLEMTNLELISKVSPPGFEGMPFSEMTNSELISKRKVINIQIAASGNWTRVSRMNLTRNVKEDQKSNSGIWTRVPAVAGWWSTTRPQRLNWNRKDNTTLLYCGVQHFLRIIQVDKSEEKSCELIMLCDGRYPDETIIGSTQYGISIISNKNLLFWKQATFLPR